MKKITSILLVLFMALLLNACVSRNGFESDESEQRVTDNTAIRAIYDKRELESILSEFVTDVVIARYLGHRVVGGLTEFEFSVSEVVVGQAADTIFVYVAKGVEIGILDDKEEMMYRPGELPLSIGYEYLLPLIRIDSAYSITHEDGFVFVREIVIDLDNPSNSTMFGIPLYRHTNLALNEEISREEIIAHVYELTKDNVARLPTIRSNAMEDIVTGSPYVLVIEIVAPRRLAADQIVTDWGLTDLYYVRVLESLKGDSMEEHGMVIQFHANTVFPGERHIVATRPIVEGYNWHEFTSRYSLFHLEQREVILSALAND